MTTNLLLSGGPLHNFCDSSRALTELLAAEGVESSVYLDPHLAIAELAARPAAWDMFTVNALRWRMTAARHEPLRDMWAFELGDDEAGAVERFVRAGGGLLACHTAVICFDADPRWRACLGASWNWERSSHPPAGVARVAVTDAGRAHPITAGTDDFSTVDEIYGFLDVDPDVVPLLSSAHGGVDHPLMWARALGRGRVVTDLLGHDAAAMDQTDHARILRRAVRWLTATAGPRQPAPTPSGPTHPATP